jgi:predicted RNase H-like HicB family nuclease
MLEKNEVHIEFDKDMQYYYAIWQPVAIGTGATRQEALDDLRQAAHFGVDIFLDLKLKEPSALGKTGHAK